MPLFFIGLLSKYALANDVWRKMAYVGSFGLIGLLYTIFTFVWFMSISLPSKFKNSKARGVYFLVVFGISFFIYWSRFYTSADKLKWTMDSYFSHNSPYDKKNPPIIAKNNKDLNDNGSDGVCTWQK